MKRHPSRYPLRRAASVAACAAALWACASTASAEVITFSGLSGEIADPLAPYSEAGFTVTPRFGAWKEGHVSGNPIPSVYVSDLTEPPFGSLEITQDEGLQFYFNSVDLSVFNSSIGYEIAGWIGTEQVFSVATSQGTTTGFITIGTSQPLIDRLTIDIGGGGPGSFNVDNINVSAVPEPGAVVLGLAGVGLVGWMRRRAQQSRNARC